MQVIGAALGRTGTMSLKVALEELGFGPCYHMLEVFNHLDHVEVWERVRRGEAIDWKSFFAGWRSGCDWPLCFYYEQLMNAFPEAKLILTVRDSEKWYESAKNSIAVVQDRRPPPADDDQSPAAQMQRANLMINHFIWEGVFEGRFEDRKFAIGAFEHHAEEVKRKVPADRLLVFDVRQGWEPLANFLDVPVPEGKPFPHLNDTQAFLDMVNRMQRGGGH